jgi:hypothetical protein
MKIRLFKPFSSDLSGLGLSPASFELPPVSSDIAAEQPGGLNFHNRR